MLQGSEKTAQIWNVQFIMRKFVLKCNTSDALIRKTRRRVKVHTLRCYNSPAVERNTSPRSYVEIYSFGSFHQLIKRELQEEKSYLRRQISAVSHEILHTLWNPKVH